jgi:hypothetical protein
MFWLPGRTVTIQTRFSPEQVRERVAILLAPTGEADCLGGNEFAFDGTSDAEGFSLRPRSGGKMVLGRHSEPSFGTAVSGSYRRQGDGTDVDLVAKLDPSLLIFALAWLTGVCLVGAVGIWLAVARKDTWVGFAVSAALLFAIGCAIFALGYRNDVNRVRDALRVVLRDSDSET